ncbi:AAA family ATPase [Mycolicibacterium sp. CBM1]
MSFSDVAAPWRAAGWVGTIPLPEKAKNPPPIGWTGRNAPYADDEQVCAWSLMPQYLRPNIGLRLGWTVVLNGVEYEVIGIDVDHYLDNGKQKLGGDQLAALESQLGKLPPTWVSTARALNDDGSDRGDWVSGIRFYLVPSGLAFRGQVDKDIEVIQKAHRFAAVWPSFNPKTETTYRLFSPQSWSDHGQPANGDEIPPVATIPELPARWVDYLTQGRMRDSARPIDMDSTLDELEAWALAQFRDSDVLCDVMAHQLKRRKALIAEDATSHDKVRDAHWEFLRLAVEGHAGWLTAINEATEFWIQDVIARDKRGYGELRTEIFRSLTNALRKVKGENGSQHYGKTPCACGKPKGIGNQGDSMDDVVQCLADVEPTAVEWLWRPWIAVGKLTILEGDPGVAKSTMTMDWAANVSRGNPWPVTTVKGVPQSVDRAEPAGVVLVGIEDDAEDTIVPRLIAADADRTRVFTMTQPLDDDGNPVPFVIPEDIDRLRRAIERSNARLVIIDPITAFLSTKQVKAGDDPSTRQALMPLANIARETRCAIVLVRHLNKSAGMDAKHRGSGSMAFTGLARSVILAGELKDPDSNRATHAIARTKGNLGRDPDTLGYALINAPSNPDIALMKWTGSLDINANQLAGADSVKDANSRSKAPLREQAEDALRLLLASGPMNASDVIEQICDKIGCSVKPVNAAANKIGVLKEKVYVDGKVDHWTWELPPVVIPFRKSGQVEAETEADDAS